MKLLNHLSIWTVINFSCLFLGPIESQIVLVPKQLNLDGNDKILLINHNNIAQLRVNLSLSFNPSIFKEHSIYNDTILMREPAKEWILSCVYQPAANPEEPFQFDSVYLEALFWSPAQPGFRHKVIKAFSIAPTWGLAYFQTDKPVYRTSETVKFRFLRLNHTFWPMIDRCDLIIKNEQNIKMDVAKLISNPPTYFSDYSFNLPSIPSKGEWSAELECDSKFNKRLTFQVRDYEAPLFKIQIDTPKIYLCDSKQINLKLNVTYTYGKPVNGYVYFKFGLTTIDRKNYKLKHTTSAYCLQNGSLNQNISLAKICSGSSQPRRLVIEAVVTDLDTNAKDTATIDSTIVSNSPYGICFRFTNLNFKPKVANYITFEVVDHDDNPVDNVPLAIQITDNFGGSVRPYITTSSIDDSDDETIFLRSDENGMVVFTFKLNKIIDSLNVDIRTNDRRLLDDQQAHRKLILHPFDHENPIQNVMVAIENKKKVFFEANEMFKTLVTAIGPVDVDRLYCIIMKGKQILHWQKIQSQTIELLLTNGMSPSIRILVLGFVKGTDQIVADSLGIIVRQNHCSVQVTLEPISNIVSPGRNLTLKLEGSPNDIVALSAVDESVKIIENKRRPLKKIKSIIENTLGHSYQWSDFYSARDSKSLIKKFGLEIVSTDQDRDERFEIVSENRARCKRHSSELECDRYHNEPCCQLARSKFKKLINCSDEKLKKIIKNNTRDERCVRIFELCCQCSFKQRKFSVLFNKFPEEMEGSSSDRSRPLLDVETENVRKDFRDSWLFDLIHMNQSLEKIDRQVPDSITSWIISIASLTGRNGFCIDKQHYVTVFKPFFVKIFLPQYVVLHEQIEILATIYNYENKSTNVVVEFYDVDGICSDVYQSLEKVRISMTIRADSSQSIRFPIIPIEIGSFQIKIKAISEKWTDYVIKNLTVIPPGVTRQHSLVLDLDPTNRAKREVFSQSDDSINKIINRIYPDQLYQDIEISLNEYSEKIVPGTIRHRLSFVGEPFRPTLKSPEQFSHLIKRPMKGCAEQSAFYMAFNLYTLKYLSQIGRLNKTTKNQGLKYLKRSFAEIMSYRKKDGSFSTFIGKDSSLWLTAFISQIICQSTDFLSHDSDLSVLQKPIEWIISRQNEYGFWTETNPISHHKGNDGLNSNTNALTAFILLTLHRCQPILHHKTLQYKVLHEILHDKILSSISKADTYVRSQAQTEKDSFCLSIMVFSLVVIPSELNASQPINYLMKHPDIVVDRKSNQMYYNHTLFSVQTSAYTLLSLNRLMGYMSERNMLFNWLNLRPLVNTLENSQDTLLTLEAISEFHSRFSMLVNRNDSSVDYRLYANISFDQRSKRSIEFGPDSVYAIEMKQDISNIKIKTLGQGFGRFELLTLYNVYKSAEMAQCHYDLEIDLFVDESLHYSPKEEENSFDYSLFFDEEFQDRMSIESLSDELLEQGPSDFEKCQAKVKRNKRLAYETENGGNEQCQFRNPPLFYLENNVPNVVLKTMKLCLERLDESSYGMVILEASIITGYKVVDEDLKLLRNHSMIEWYEIAGHKVIFYLKHQPKNNRLCVCFRIYQEHIVEYVQSAQVQVYDYFKKDSNCFRFYTDIGYKSSYLNYACQNEACRCVLNKACPNNEQLHRIKSKSNRMASFEIFRNIVCRYPLVFVANIQFENQIKPDERMILLTINSFQIIRGDRHQPLSKLKLKLDSEICSLKEKSESFDALVMIDSIDWQRPTFHLNGSSVFKVIDNKLFIDDLIWLFSYSPCPT